MTSRKLRVRKEFLDCAFFFTHLRRRMTADGLEDFPKISGRTELQLVADLFHRIACGLEQLSRLFTEDLLPNPIRCFVTAPLDVAIQKRLADTAAFGIFGDSAVRIFFHA